MIMEMIRANVLLPASTRVGTLAAGGLVTLGMTVDHANAVGLSVAAVLGFGCDLILAWYRKRSIQKATANEVIGAMQERQMVDAGVMEARRKARGE